MKEQFFVRGAVGAESMEIDPPFIIDGEWTINEIVELLGRRGDIEERARIIHIERSEVGEKPKPRPKAVK